MKYLSPIVVAVVLSFVSSAAFAAQFGTVGVQGAEVRDGPGEQFKVIEKLGPRSKIGASNQPKDGYYKVRTPSGAVGWIPAGAIEFKASGSALIPLGKPDQAVASGFKPKKKGEMGTPGFEVRLLGGMDFFNMKEINTQVGFEGLKSGIGFGGEIKYSFAPSLAAVLRAEYLSKGVIGKDSASTKTYEFSANSMPLMVGVEYPLMGRSGISASLGLLVGLGLQTKLTSTSTSDASPNITELSSTALGGLLKANIGLRLSKMFSLFGEAGYRYLKTGKLTPKEDVNGSELFKSGSSFVPLPIDFSGVVIGGGVSIGF